MQKNQNNQKLKTRSQEVILQDKKITGGTKFKAFQIYADMSKVDRTWEKYGYVKAPLAVKKPNGDLSSRSHKSQVVIYQNDFRKLLSNSYALIPHEFVQEILERYVLKNVSDLRMSIDKDYSAHDGDSHYWTILSDDKFKVDGHDNFQVGVSIRNGIGTNVSLGADLYTMRLICTNGAVARGRNFGSFSIPHIGKIELVSKYFEKLIRHTFARSMELIKIYEKANKIKVNDEIATQIYKKMPYAARYLPTTWNIASRYRIKDLKKEGKYKEGMILAQVITKNQTLFEAFNEITERQRDGLRTGKINFSAVSTHQVGLHNAMIEIVNQRRS